MNSPIIERNGKRYEWRTNQDEMLWRDSAAARGWIIGDPHSPNGTDTVDFLKVMGLVGLYAPLED